MKNRALLVAFSVVAFLMFLGWWLHDESAPRPLVCEQIAPGVKYAKPCDPHELQRIRNAYRWVAENIAPPLSIEGMAAIASFIEDTGRHKRTHFYKQLARGDITGACDRMMAHVNHRGKPDPERIVRRGHERALCLSEGRR